MASEEAKASIQTVEGGCLCEAIRYTITFPPDHDFSKNVTTCQCEQCRKNTGSLLGRFHHVPSSAVTISPSPALKRFYATPPVARGFCSECGSFLFWQRRDQTYIAVGTLDKKYLIGEGGVLLTKGSMHFWCADQVPGVTDHLEGERWKYDCVGDGVVELMD